MSRSDALEIFQAGVAAVRPENCMPNVLMIKDGRLLCGDFATSLETLDHIFVLGAGKASAAMALQTEEILGDLVSDGLVITKYGHCLPLQKLKCLEAGHPLPDQNGVNATRELLFVLSRAGGNDLVIFLISGGASALLADLPPGLRLEELQEANRLLLNAGATITEMNTLRKHLSLLKGGQLLRTVNGAAILSLVISDVPGNDPSVIASGPTYPDSSTFGEAWGILAKYRLTEKVPASVQRRIQEGINGKLPETPKPGDPLFDRAFYCMLATNEVALEAARKKAISLGYRGIIHNKNLKGESREEAKKFADALRQYKGKRPACLLMGGETTVTVRGNGKGGRNQEFVLAALQTMNKSRSLLPLVLSAGTDGTDGPTNATGAIADEEIIQRARALNLQPEEFLDNNNAYPFFEKAGGLIITGPTHTNVMDIVVGLIY